MTWKVGTMYLIPNALIDSSENEVFNMGWERHGGSNFKHYIVYVAWKYKTIFFSKRANHTHIYILDNPIISLLFTPSLRYYLAQFVFQCEKRRGGTNEETCWLCIFCPNYELKYDILLQCSMYDHIHISLWSISWILISF